MLFKISFFTQQMFWFFFSFDNNILSGYHIFTEVSKQSELINNHYIDKKRNY